MTGRPSTLRLLGSIADFPAYWVPAFAGTTTVKQAEFGQDRVGMLAEDRKSVG